MCSFLFSNDAHKECSLSCSDGSNLYERKMLTFHSNVIKLLELRLPEILTTPQEVFITSISTWITVKDIRKFNCQEKSTLQLSREVNSTNVKGSQLYNCQWQGCGACCIKTAFGIRAPGAFGIRAPGVGLSTESKYQRVSAFPRDINPPPPPPQKKVKLPKSAWLFKRYKVPRSRETTKY